MVVEIQMCKFVDNIFFISTSSPFRQNSHTFKDNVRTAARANILKSSNTIKSHSHTLHIRIQHIRPFFSTLIHVPTYHQIAESSYYRVTRKKNENNIKKSEINEVRIRIHVHIHIHRCLLIGAPYHFRMDVYD